MRTQESATALTLPTKPSRTWPAWLLLILTLLLAVAAWGIARSPVAKTLGSTGVWFPSWSLVFLFPALSLAVFLYATVGPRRKNPFLGTLTQLAFLLVQATGLGQWTYHLMTTQRAGPYSSHREYVSADPRPDGWLDPVHPSTYDLGGGVRLVMPLTCLVDASGDTLPRMSPTTLAPPVRNDSIRPLTSQGLQNLVTFTRAFGYLRFFHPSDQAASADWNMVALVGMQVMEDAPTPEDLAKRLQSFFAPIAPTVQFLAPGTSAQPQAKPEGGQQLVRWKHTGMGPLPAPPKATFDRSMRLGDVALLWSVMQHFYPYFDVVKVDWARELSTALQQAALDADERALRRTLRILVAALHDGHGNVTFTQSFPAKAPALKLRIIDGKAYMAWGPASIPPGSEILAFNEESLATRSAWIRQEISSPTDGYQNSNLERRLLAGLPGSVVRISFRTPQGTDGAVDVPLEPYPKDLAYRGLPKTIEELKPGVWYLDLDRIQDKEFEAILPTIANAKGVIFDLRGYPNMSTAFLEHLTDKPIMSARWNVPVVLEPDGRNWTWNTNGRWELHPKTPRIRGKVVFLTGGGAISYAESCLGIVEAYRLGEIVGEPSAGTNGNVNPFQLPGGFKVVWTGMKVLKHDGSRHHGVGIHPTIPVTPSQNGLAMKRDEVLDQSLAEFSDTNP